MGKISGYTEVLLRARKRKLVLTLTKVLISGLTPTFAENNFRKKTHNEESYISLRNTREETYPSKRDCGLPWCGESQVWVPTRAADESRDGKCASQRWRESHTSGRNAGDHQVGVICTCLCKVHFYTVLLSPNPCLSAFKGESLELWVVFSNMLNMAFCFSIEVFQPRESSLIWFGSEILT